MPISNLNNDHFSPDEKMAVDQGWNMILSVLQRKARNLSPEERSRYGSVSEENKLVVQKVLDYSVSQPHLNCPEVNYQELRADWDDRNFLASLISKLVEGTNIANNIRITHDYDAFANSRIDYDYCKYRKDIEPGAGFETKYRDLLYFFKTNSGAKPEEKEPPAAPAG